MHQILLTIQHIISFLGVMIILSGVLFAIAQYIVQLLKNELLTDDTYINDIRLRLGRVLVLGLEFIVAADLIGTTTAPDYYSVGILAIIVIIRTILSYTINREIHSLSHPEN